MTTFVVRNGELVEKPPRQSSAPGFVPMRDIEPFVTMEGKEITSRSALRDYERAHGIRQCGNDWTGSTKPAFWDAYQARKRGER